MRSSVTVIMSVHNGADTVKQAIESVLAQTMEEFIFHITLDACTDSTEEIVNSFDDQRIKVVSNEVNLGLTVSLINAVDTVTTPFWARIDADDCWSSEKLSAQANFMNQHSDIFVYGESHSLKSDRHTLTSPADLSLKNNIIHSSVLVRTDRTMNYDPSFRFAQDYELWLRILRAGKNISIGPNHTVVQGESLQQISVKSEGTQRAFSLKAKLRHTPLRCWFSARYVFYMVKDLYVSLVR